MKIIYPLIIITLIIAGCNANQIEEGQVSFPDDITGDITLPVDEDMENDSMQDEDMQEEYADNADEMQDETEDNADDEQTVTTTIQMVTTTSTTTTQESEELQGQTVIRIKEGDKVELKLRADDPDDNQITYTFSSPLDSSGEWQTETGDAGEYNVIVTASDGVSSTSKNVKIIVEAANNVPEIANLESISEITVDEGETISINPIIVDEEGDDVEVEYSGFMTSSTYTTNYDDSGQHTVSITLDDGKSQVTKDIVITVNNVNRAPELRQIDDIEIMEGETVEVDAMAIDPDGDDIEITYSEPFDEDGQWQTEVGDAGEYDAIVTASDESLSDQESFTVTVMSENRAPVILELDDIVVEEGDTVNIDPVVSDPDGDSVQVSYSGWMTTSQYKTDFNDAGEHTVTITASDGKTQTTQTVNVIVQDKNRPPTDLEIEVVVIPGDE